MADQIKKLSAGHSIEVLDGIMSEVEEARGEYDSLGERLDEMSSGTPAPSTAAPAMDGTAAAGTSTDYARADHVHPSDTSRASAASEAEDRAALVELVDGGAKNRVPLSFTATSADFTVGYLNNKLIINGTSTSAQSVYSDIYLDIGTYMLTGCPTGGGADNYQCELRTSTGGSMGTVDTGNGKQFTITTAGNYRYNVRLAANYTASNLDISPMICTKAAWDISHEYQPYRPSYQELYDMVKALQPAI